MERKKIGDILIELDVLTAHEVERILQAQRRRGGAGKFGQIGRSMGLVREEHILAALAVQLQLLPGAADLTMSRLLRRLSAVEMTAAVPSRRSPLPPQVAGSPS